MEDRVYRSRPPSRPSVFTKTGYLWQNLTDCITVSVTCCLYLCSVGGLILDKTVSDPNFAGMAVFTPVINGEVLAPTAGGRGGRERLW